MKQSPYAHSFAGDMRENDDDAIVAGARCAGSPAAMLLACRLPMAGRYEVHLSARPRVRGLVDERRPDATSTRWTSSRAWAVL
jgi:hypothetical protein